MQSSFLDLILNILSGLLNKLINMVEQHFASGEAWTKRAQQIRSKIKSKDALPESRLPDVGHNELAVE